jgi:Gpi18-like mannosyltransferase
MNAWLKGKIDTILKYPMEFFLIWVMLGMGLIIRFSFINWISGDYNNFLKPWMVDIVDGGGLASLGTRIGDYTPAYIYLLTLLSYFPQSGTSDPFLLGIKLISIGFDLILMVSVYLNAKLWLKKLHPLFPVVIAVISLFLPTVLINGSLWGQIDASYTAFSLIALYYLQKNKPFVSSLWYGLAISFKLQAIFFLPVFLIFFWFHHRRKIHYVFMLPLVYYVLAIPALIAGRSFLDITQIYVLQSENYRLLTLNMPNLYQWFPNQRYDDISTYAFGLFAGLMTLQLLMMIMLKVNLKKDHLLLLSYWSVLMANFFLPAMHERYLFAADVIIVLVAFQSMKSFYLILLTQAISLLAYGPFLFGLEPIKHEEVAIGFAFVLILTTYWLWQALLKDNPQRS